MRLGRVLLIIIIFGRVLRAHSHYPSTADNSSSRVAAAAIFILQCFHTTVCECCIVDSPLLTVLFSTEQQGSINERPLTIRSQLWLSEHSTVCSFNTQPHFPDNCVIRVCINNWSPNRDMYYAPVCLICQIEVTFLLMTDWSSNLSEMELQKASYCPLEISYSTVMFSVFAISNTLFFLRIQNNTHTKKKGGECWNFS